MSETITWNNAHGFDCSSCGHTQEPCEHWKLFVNAQASAAPQATSGLRELVAKWRKQRPEGSMSWDCAAELEAVLAQSQVPGITYSLEQINLMLSSARTHVLMDLAEAYRAKGYRIPDLLNEALAAQADPAPAGLGEALKGGDGSYKP